MQPIERDRRQEEHVVAYPVSVVIGIRTGGVFSGATDMDDMGKRILKVAGALSKEGHQVREGCVSGELTATKGSMVVIAGVFNYFGEDETDEFCRALSKEFGTEVMASILTETTDSFRSGLYLDGKPIHKVSENPLGRMMRRTV
jgi:hypothetical protein